VIAALLIGLIVGLGIGVVVGYEILPTHNGAGTNNQVQVSGTINLGQSGTILFDNNQEVENNRSTTIIQASAPIINSQYSITLVSGHSYNVTVTIESWGVYQAPTNTTYNDFSIYIPLGVTTFTANF
jgi:hypothetical protein